jgi:preprotein translocase subunit YajC
VVVFGGMMYFTIAPQRRHDREWREMIKKLRRGHRVLTKSGMYGLVTDVKDDVVTVRVADKVEIKMAKAGIQELVGSAAADDRDEGDGGGAKGDRRGR